MELVRVEGLVKEYPPFRLGPLDLEVPGGYVVGLVGPNGAGKSTFLKMLVNLVRPSRGRLECFGLEYPQGEREIKRRIGFVPEEPFLYPEMNAAWLGRFVSRYYPTWDGARYTELLRRFGVDPRQPTGKLSRGTKVKVELALALAHRPDLLILDEPTSGLDPLVRRELLEELVESVQDERCSVIFSTHITEDVERIADYVAFLVQGRLALMADRETLRQEWQEFWLDDPGGDLPGVVRREQGAGRLHRLWVSRATSAGRVLQEKGIRPFRSRALELDEILQVLVTGEGRPGSRPGEERTATREVSL